MKTLRRAKTSLKSAQTKFMKTKIGQAIRPFVTPRNRYIIGLIIATGISAYLMVVYITIWQYQDYEKITDFLFNKPEIVIYSTTTMFSLSVLLIALFGNWPLTIGGIYAVITGLMFANMEKMYSRDTPLLPEDLLMAGEASALSGMVRMNLLFFTVIGIIGILIFSFWLDKKLKQRYQFKFPKRYTRILRLLLVLSSATMLASHTDFLRTKTHGNYMKIDFLATEVNAWNQEENYRRNGFIIGTIFNLQPKTMDEPANYSEESVQAIVEKYTRIAESENQKRQSINKDDVNIVYVMSESFMDPQMAHNFADFSPAEVIPTTRSIMSHYSSGYAASSEFGGGTANVEFEALTGFSNYFLNIVPFSGFVSRASNFPSLAQYLQKNGYQTTALHPFGRTMYKRDFVYPNLGFGNFKAIEDFITTNRLDNSEYVSDHSSFEQVLYEIEQSEDPQFIHLVTMQNHMPYKPGAYAENTVEIHNTAENNIDKAGEIATYLTGINKSDQAMQFFVDELAQSDEKTIVVFWGDHWPGAFNGALDEDEKYISRQAAMSTPFFIYKNFDSGQDRQELGEISLNLTPLMTLNEINAKLPPFYYLLQDLYKKYPALTRVAADESASSDSLVKDYELIQYDIVNGRRWSAGEFYGM